MTLPKLVACRATFFTNDFWSLFWKLKETVDIHVVYHTIPTVQYYCSEGKTQIYFSCLWLDILITKMKIILGLSINEAHGLPFHEGTVADPKLLLAQLLCRLKSSIVGYVPMSFWLCGLKHNSSRLRNLRNPINRRFSMYFFLSCETGNWRWRCSS